MMSSEKLNKNQNNERFSAIRKYEVAAQLNFQFHMLARLDDTCNVPRENIQVHPNFEFALKTRLNWMKNCNEEYDAHCQVILGSLDSNFCVLISLGIWLVIFFVTFHMPNSHLMCLVSLLIVHFQREEHPVNK